MKSVIWEAFKKRAYDREQRRIAAIKAQREETAERIRQTMEKYHDVYGTTQFTGTTSYFDQQWDER